ncbi:hypothetical protein VNI00_013498 [Paramarasmius palmivorus]|uniref:Bacteriophage T5 Orf172 DNA-binding domain-containing protein n=1 Tax=Paramarasmius palmivorus TaxID=297713 RepID=A0AAW0BVR9_9AGAR
MRSGRFRDAIYVLSTVVTRRYGHSSSSQHVRAAYLVVCAHFEPGKVASAALAHHQQHQTLALLHPAQLHNMGPSLSIMLARIKLAAKRLSPLSFFEKKGTIYGFILEDATQDGRLIKVGRTSRPLEVRMAEWDECTTFVHKWFPGYEVRASRRVERMVHLELESRGYERVPLYCSKCGRRHIEIFRVPDDGAWDNIILPLIKQLDRETP